MKEQSFTQAKDDAFNFLSYRERSQYELIQKLKKKGYKNTVINKVITHLNKLDYLNDYRFTRKWIKDRIQFKPRGKYLLRHELKEKGIDNKIINKILNELIDENLEITLSRKLAKKWLKSHEVKNDQLVKLKRYLYNKGFSTQIINRVTNDLFN